MAICYRISYLIFGLCLKVCFFPVAHTLWDLSWSNYSFSLLYPIQRFLENTASSPESFMDSKPCFSKRFLWWMYLVCILWIYYCLFPLYANLTVRNSCFRKSLRSLIIVSVILFIICMMMRLLKFQEAVDWQMLFIKENGWPENQMTNGSFIITSPLSPMYLLMTR